MLKPQLTVGSLDMFKSIWTGLLVIALIPLTGHAQSDDEVIATVTLDRGVLRPYEYQQTHSVIFADGTVFEISLFDRQFDKDASALIDYIKIDGNRISPNTEEHRGMEDLLSSITNFSVENIFCMSSDAGECTKIRVELSGNYVDHNMQSDDDAQCLLELDIASNKLSCNCISQS